MYCSGERRFPCCCIVNDTLPVLKQFTKAITGHSAFRLYIGFYTEDTLKNPLKSLLTRLTHILHIYYIYVTCPPCCGSYFVNYLAAVSVEGIMTSSLHELEHWAQNRQMETSVSLALFLTNFILSGSKLDSSIYKPTKITWLFRASVS